MEMTRMVSVALAVLFIAASAAAQVAPPPGANHPTMNCDRPALNTYLLGPDDELETSSVEPDELTSKSTRIDGDGAIQVLLVGRVHVAGLTVEQAEQEVNKRLSAYIRHPQFAINLKELRSQPVSILGAVNTPGIHQVQGHQTLLEMISLAGGIRPDAGYSIRITRESEWGCIPLPNATLDASGGFSVAEVNLKDIMEAKNPKENIQIFPHDVVTVPKAEMVYVIGDVHRSGGFVLGENKTISVLQALSLAEGLGMAAKTRDAKILRVNPAGDQRTEIPVDVPSILAGKKKDFPLQSDDILFIPDSKVKKAFTRALEATVQAGTNVAVWRIP
jgi:polysaccharide biosynthesis/export protein